METRNKITKKSLWKNYMGDIKPFDELEDSHLVNIAKHVMIHKYEHRHDIYAICCEVLTYRGISLEILKYAQIPHKNQFGEWAVWDDETYKPVTLMIK